MCPKNLYAVSRCASLYSILKKYDEAINEYTYLMKQEPKYFPHVEACARMYAHLNQVNTALDLINNFYKRKKMDADYYNAIGYVLYIAKDYNLAIKNLKQAINLNPNQSTSYSILSYIYMDMGDNAKSQKYRRKADKLMDALYNEHTKKTR